MFNRNYTSFNTSIASITDYNLIRLSKVKLSTTDPLVVAMSSLVKLDMFGTAFELAVSLFTMNAQGQYEVVLISYICNTSDPANPNNSVFLVNQLFKDPNGRCIFPNSTDAWNKDLSFTYLGPLQSFYLSVDFNVIYQGKLLLINTTYSGLISRNPLLYNFTSSVLTNNVLKVMPFDNAILP